MLIAPQITRPFENSQFNLGSVEITWESATNVDFTDFGSIEQFRYDWDQDITKLRWLDIQAMLEDAAEDAAYGGMDYVEEMFADPASKATSPPLLDGTSFSDELGDFTVILIESVYDTNFEFDIVSSTTGRNTRSYLRHHLMISLSP